MKKIILTSTGLENPNIEKQFHKMVNKEAKEVKAIFVPTAAIDDGAKAVLPKCWNDLIRNNILEKNIYVYNLDHAIDPDVMDNYDVIYFCGGNTKHLMHQINKQKEFKSMLKKFVERGGVYVGVSAGSCIATHNMINGLGFVNCLIDVHKAKGSENGEIILSRRTLVNLTNSQALIVDGNRIFIME